ncbi:MAG: GDYXXLXY domain-containing protein [Okeania sp. SIO2H7]|mgnify:CR=1 FL=1|nr:GDYXXLXY domain-containing protein [Okeania sp. SIO2H7]
MKLLNFFGKSKNSQSDLDNLESLKETTAPEVDFSQRTNKPIKNWRFLLPFALQMGLILSVPAQAFYTHVTGTTVVLQTVPVDPYDFLRGYYQVLNYDISTSNNLKELPGWDELAGENSRGYLPRGKSVYVVLEKPTGEDKEGKPFAWKPVAVRGTLPEDLPENRIAIKGRSNGSRIEYGLESYFMPEDRRNEVNDDILGVQREAFRENEQIPFVVEVKVNSSGGAVPVSLWVRDRNYRF